MEKMINLLLKKGFVMNWNKDDIVIGRTNENEPLVCGTILGDARELYNLRSPNYIPVIRIQDAPPMQDLTLPEEQEVKIFMGLVVPYNDLLWNTLKSLEDYKTQWNYLLEIFYPDRLDQKLE